MSIIKSKWQLVGIWWLTASIIAVLIVLPIVIANIPFDWLYYNIAYIVGSITIIRILFGLKYHPLAQSRIFKTVLILMAPILFFPILEGIHSFLEFNDREGLQSIMAHLSIESQNWFMHYIRIEYIFFAMSCMVGVFALIVKMIRSLWRQYRFNEI